jgi:RNA polymerase sigma-70 factor (ECF subfamily)
MVADSGSGGDAALPEVVDRAERGDAEAFGELYQLLARRVRGLCLHLLGSREDAEDATSEVFLRMRAALGRYDRSVPLGAWLASIATNLCIDRLRRRGREGRLFEPEPQPEPSGSEPSPLVELMAEEQRAALGQAIAGLPERYRVPLTLRYYGEMSYDEIAARLGLTREQVAINLFRAKQRLRQALAPEATP